MRKWFQTFEITARWMVRHNSSVGWVCPLFGLLIMCSENAVAVTGSTKYKMSMAIIKQWLWCSTLHCRVPYHTMYDIEFQIPNEKERERVEENGLRMACSKTLFWNPS